MVMATLAVAEPRIGGSSAEVAAAVVKFWQDCGGSRASVVGGARGGFHFLLALPPTDHPTCN